MPQNKRNVKQVSLDFKNLSEEASSRIETLDKEAATQVDKDEDCKIVFVSSAIDPKNQRIDKFFAKSVKRNKVTKDCKSNSKTNSIALKPDNHDDSGRQVSEDEIMDLRDSEEVQLVGNEEGDSFSEDSSSSDEKSSRGDDDVSVEEKDDLMESDSKNEAKNVTENKNTKSKKKSENATEDQPPKKKRRPSSVVQAEKLQKELDKARRRVEKEAARLKRLEEKEEKEKEKKRLREALAAEREAARLQAEKEKEEKRLKREEERLKREEERLKREDEKRERDRLREEERIKKEEERRRREEEKLQLEVARKEKEDAKKQEQEELQRRKEKQASFFNKFFIKDSPAEAVTVKETNEKEIKSATETGPFIQFQIKKGMRLAPYVRRSAAELSKIVKELDNFLKDKGIRKKCDLYVCELRSGRRKPLSAGATWPLEKSDDVEYLGSGNESAPAVKWYRVKLLQFAENSRPPYYGTFRRQSRFITGRCPSRKDTQMIDYSVDSDEEWEDEEAGESLSHSEGDDEEGDEDQDEENDGFFVPHGYLSEDEGAEDEEDKLTPEMRKMKQQLSEARFEALMQKKIQPVQNVIIPPSVDPSQHPMLKSFKVIEMTDVIPIPISISAVGVSTSGKTAIKNGVPDEAMGDVVRLLHGNRLGMRKILFEFRMFWEHKSSGRLPAVTYNEDLKGRDWKEFSISKSQLERKIREIAKYEDNCWRVQAETLAQFPADEVNSWEYLTDVANLPRRKKQPQSPEATPQQPVSPEESKVKPPSPEIRKGGEATTESINVKKETPMKPIYSFFKESSGTPSSEFKAIKKSNEETPKQSQSTKEQKSRSMIKKVLKKGTTDAACESLKEGKKVTTGVKKSPLLILKRCSVQGENSAPVRKRGRPKKVSVQSCGEAKDTTVTVNGDDHLPPAIKNPPQKISFQKTKTGPTIKRLNTQKSKPIKVKIPIKKRPEKGTDKENLVDDNEIIDLCD